MKVTRLYIGMIFSLLSIAFGMVGCSDEYEYSTDYTAYDGASLAIDLVDQNNVLNLNLSNGTYSIKVNVTPEDILIGTKGYIYEIADETIATVNAEGTLEMLKEGETELTVKFRGNQKVSTSCTVKISLPTTSELKVPADVTLEVEKTFNLFEQITTVPSDASHQFEYQVEDGSVAAIDENGLITGLAEGDTKIIVRTTDGTNISAEVPVKVLGKIYISDIRFPDEKVKDKTFVAGQILKLANFVTLLPENASEPIVKYTLASGSGVVALDADGTVTCLAAGTATIKIEAMDNNPTPINAKEVTLTIAATGWYEPALWTIDTSYRFTQNNGKVVNYTYNGTTNGPAELLLDGDTRTSFCLVKPGKAYPTSFGNFTNDDTEQFVVVDMGAPTAFNKIYYAHSTATVASSAKITKISVYGSSDGKTFTGIQAGIKLPNTPAEQEFDLPLSTYRYVKVSLDEWPAAGYTFLVSEINFCKE